MRCFCKLTYLYCLEKSTSVACSALLATIVLYSRHTSRPVVPFMYRPFPPVRLKQGHRTVQQTYVTYGCTLHVQTLPARQAETRTSYCTANIRHVRLYRSCTDPSRQTGWNSTKQIHFLTVTSSLKCLRCSATFFLSISDERFFVAWFLQRRSGCIYWRGFVIIYYFMLKSEK